MACQFTASVTATMCSTTGKQNNGSSPARRTLRFRQVEAGPFSRAHRCCTPRCRRATGMWLLAQSWLCAWRHLPMDYNRICKCILAFKQTMYVQALSLSLPFAARAEALRCCRYYAVLFRRSLTATAWHSTAAFTPTFSIVFS